MHWERQSQLPRRHRYFGITSEPELIAEEILILLGFPRRSEDGLK